MTVTNSCCCFGLRTGAMIIGWFGLIGGIIGLVSYIQAISIVHDVVEMLNATMANMSEAEKSMVTKIDEDALKGLFYTLMALEVVAILICASLLWGVYKNNHLLLLPWLLTNGLYLGLGVLLLLIMSISCFVGGAAVPGVVILVVGLLSMLLPIYFWLCIFSLYQRFRLEGNRGGRRCNEEGFGVSAPMMESKPPPYNIHKL